MSHNHQCRNSKASITEGSLLLYCYVVFNLWKMIFLTRNNKNKVIEIQHVTIIALALTHSEEWAGLRVSQIIDLDLKQHQVVTVCCVAWAKQSHPSPSPVHSAPWLQRRALSVHGSQKASRFQPPRVAADCVFYCPTAAAKTCSQSGRNSLN